MGRASTTALPPADSSVEVRGRTRTPTRTWQEVSAEPGCVVVVVVMIDSMAENSKRIFVVDDSLAHGERNGTAVSYQYVSRCEAGSATEGRRLCPRASRSTQGRAEPGCISYNAKQQRSCMPMPSRCRRLATVKKIGSARKGTRTSSQPGSCSDLIQMRRRRAAAATDRWRGKQASQQSRRRQESSTPKQASGWCISHLAGSHKHEQ